MIDPRKIDVAYADGHWLAVGSDFDPIDSPSLMHLITAVQHICPDEALIFVVDKPTAEGHDDAEAQFLEAGEKSGAFVVWSTECY
jgi:hypothetical protein